MKQHRTIIRFTRPNDTNGNPKRLFVLIETTMGSLIEAWPEGYDGKASIPSRLRKFYNGLSFEVSPEEYQYLKRLVKTEADQ